MKNLKIKTFFGFSAFLVLAGAMLFLSAWTFHYWQAWVFLAVFFGSSLAITLYLMKNDPVLLGRRISVGPINEKEKSQKIIQSIAQLSFILVVVFPVFDHRFMWSTVPPYVSVVGDLLIAIGFYIVFLVFKENTYASALIEVTDEQKVISSGPYALVRHPMYSGALILLLGTPLALGSWWGVLTIIPITAVIVWRLLDEERFLLKSLPGYAEYKNKVKYRLVPFVW